MWLLMPVLVLLSVALTSSCGCLPARTAQAFHGNPATRHQQQEEEQQQQHHLHPLQQERRRGHQQSLPEATMLHNVGDGNASACLVVKANEKQHRHKYQQQRQYQQHQQLGGQMDHHVVVERGEGTNASLIEENGEKQQGHEGREKQGHPPHQQRGRETQDLAAKQGDSDEGSGAVDRDSDEGAAANDEYSRSEESEEHSSTDRKEKEPQKNDKQTRSDKEDGDHKEERQEPAEEEESSLQKQAPEKETGQPETRKSAGQRKTSSQGVSSIGEEEEPEEGEQPPSGEQEPAEEGSAEAVQPKGNKIKSASRSSGSETAIKQAQKVSSSYEEDLEPPEKDESVSYRGEEEPSAETPTPAAKEGGREEKHAARGEETETKAPLKAKAPSETPATTSTSEEADLTAKVEKGKKSSTDQSAREGVLEALSEEIPGEAPAKPPVQAESNVKEDEKGGAGAAQPLDQEATATAAAPKGEAGSGEGVAEVTLETKGAKYREEREPGSEEEEEDEVEPQEDLHIPTAGATPTSTSEKEEELKVGETAQKSPPEEARAPMVPTTPVAGSAEETTPAPEKEEKEKESEEAPAAAVVPAAKEEAELAAPLPEAKEQKAQLPQPTEEAAGAGVEAPETVGEAVTEEKPPAEPGGKREEEQQQEEPPPSTAKRTGPAVAGGPPEAGAAAEATGAAAFPKDRGDMGAPVSEAAAAAVETPELGHPTAAAPQELAAGGVASVDRQRALALAAARPEVDEKAFGDVYAEEVVEAAESFLPPEHPEEEEAVPELKDHEVEIGMDHALETEAAPAEGGACYKGRRIEAARRRFRLLQFVLANRNFRSLEQAWCDMLLKKIDGAFSERQVEHLLRAAAVAAAASRIHRNFRFCIATARSSPPRVKDGDSVLHAAVAASKPRVVELLLQYGAFPNMEALPRSSAFAMHTGQRPLHYAAQQQTLENVEAVLLLLQYGALIDAVDVRGRTPLMAAAEAPGPHVGRFIALLVDKGADVLARDHAGLQALHYAAAADSAEAVEHLLSNGAAAAAEDMRGNTPLHYAAMFNAAKALRALLRHARGNYSDIDVVNESGKAAIHFAAAPIMMDGLPRRVLPPLALEELLLHHDANPTARDHEQNTPLMHAAAQGYTEMVKALLQITESVPEAANMEGKTAFDLAVDQGRQDIAQLLKDATSGTTCTSVPKVRHAMEYFSDSQYGPFLRVGDTVSYICDKGFQMEGKSTLTCMTRDDFSEFIPTPPTCIKSGAAGAMWGFPLFYYMLPIHVLLGAVTLL